MRIAEWKMSSPRHISKQNAPPRVLSADTSSGLFKYLDDTEVYKVVKIKGLVMRSPSLMRCLHGLLKTSFNYTPVNAMN